MKVRKRPAAATPAAVFDSHLLDMELLLVERGW
jgi:hypothetical protein